MTIKETDPDWQKFLEKKYDPGDIVILDDDNFDDVVYNSPEIWIVVFSVDFCKHCKSFAPIYKEVSANLMRNANFAYVDAVANKGLQKRFGIKSVPQVFYWEPGYYKTDADVKKYKGEKTVESLSKMVNEMHGDYTADMLTIHSKKSSRWSEDYWTGQVYESDYEPVTFANEVAQAPIPEILPMEIPQPPTV